MVQIYILYYNTPSNLTLFNCFTQNYTNYRDTGQNV